jgi:hypothetical protein
MYAIRPVTTNLAILPGNVELARLAAELAIGPLLLVQEVRELRSEPFMAQVARINVYRIYSPLREPGERVECAGCQCREGGHEINAFEINRSIWVAT